MKLFHKLLWFFLPVSLFYLFGFWLCVYIFTTSYIEDKLQKDFRAMAALHIKAINMWVEHSQEQLDSFNSRLLIRKILAEYPEGNIPPEKFRQLQKIINSTQKLVSSFDELYLLNQQGTVVSSTNADSLGTTIDAFQPQFQTTKKHYLAKVIVNDDANVQLQHAIELALDNKIVGFLVVNTHGKSLKALLQTDIGLGEMGNLMILRENIEKRLQPLFMPLRTMPNLNEANINVTNIDVAIAQQDYHDKLLTLNNQDNQIVFAYIEDINSVNWKLLITLPKTEAFQVISEIRIFGLAIVILAGTLLIFTVIYVARLLSVPIEELAHHASHQNDQDNSREFEKSGIAEYDKLSIKLNKLMDNIREEKQNLEANVASRTQDLATRNQQLYQAMKELKNTQNLLIETEKMAALGEMVAGVAHEVNTPIGSALGAASHLKDTSAAAQNAYEQGNLTEEEFENLLAANQMSTEIVVSNLQRAGELIRSFKRVAVDQTSENLLEFDLVEYIQDVVLSLGPRHKHMKLTFNWTGLAGIKVRQVPGVIAQVMSNLIVNAIVHGFENQVKGTITLNIQESADNLLQITVADDGNGMAEETRQKLFDPFFTTKRGQGGTGLGMNIVYNLVVKNLGGHIGVASMPGKGASITFSFPRYQNGVQI